ncbi:hypothetical protein QQ045_001141 [Rhodiola kirilowii]
MAHGNDNIRIGSGRRGSGRWLDECVMVERRGEAVWRGVPAKGEAGGRLLLLLRKYTFSLLSVVPQFGCCVLWTAREASSRLQQQFVYQEVMGSNCVDTVGPEQLCYIPCNFCNIILAVSVPCSSLFDIVTVRCGHCTNLWSVNMAVAFQSAFSRQDFHHHHQVPNCLNGGQDYYWMDHPGSSSNVANKRTSSLRVPAQQPREERVVNRPPEKKQRVPSAYNRFIKEEIQRIKANNPDISHREAFSTAAKNILCEPKRRRYDAVFTETTSI